MKTVTLGMWELEYKEAGNELILFVNPYETSAVMFSLTNENIDSILEAVLTEGKTGFTLTGQAMVPIETKTYFLDYGGLNGEEYGYEETEFNYTLKNSGLDAFKIGEPETYTVEFDDSTRKMLAYDLWQEPALEWLTLPQS